MLYYRVKKEYDGKPFSFGSPLQFVRNELYTAKECARLGVPACAVDPVEVSKRRVGWFFGARFSFDCGYFD